MFKYIYMCVFLCNMCVWVKRVVLRVDQRGVASKCAKVHFSRKPDRPDHYTPLAWLSREVRSYSILPYYEPSYPSWSVTRRSWWTVRADITRRYIHKSSEFTRYSGSPTISLVKEKIVVGKLIVERMVDIIFNV